MKKQKVHHPAFQDILDSIRRSWRRKLMGLSVLIILLLTGIACLPDWYKMMPMTGLAVSLWGVYRLCWRGPLRHSPLFQLLTQTPERIVWIYGYQLTRAPLGLVLSSQHRIYVQTNDKKSYSLDLPASRYLVVMKWLNRVLPDAAFGWDDLRYQRWLQNGSV